MIEKLTIWPDIKITLEEKLIAKRLLFNTTEILMVNEMPVLMLMANLANCTYINRASWNYKNFK